MKAFNTSSDFRTETGISVSDSGAERDEGGRSGAGHGLVGLVAGILISGGLLATGHGILLAILAFSLGSSVTMLAVALWSLRPTRRAAVTIEAEPLAAQVAHP